MKHKHDQQAATAEAWPASPGKDPALLVACYGQPRKSLLSPAALQEAKLAWGGSISDALGATSAPVLDVGVPQFDHRMLLGPPAQEFSDAADAPATPHLQSGPLSVGELKQIMYIRPSSSPHAARPKRQPSKPVDVPPEVETAPLSLLPPKKMCCAACVRGFSNSSASPHGPDGFPDRARCRVGARPNSQPAGGTVKLRGPEGESDAIDTGNVTVARPHSQGVLSKTRGESGKPGWAATAAAMRGASGKSGFAAAAARGESGKNGLGASANTAALLRFVQHSRSPSASSNDIEGRAGDPIAAAAPTTATLMRLVRNRKSPRSVSSSEVEVWASDTVAEGLTDEPPSPVAASSKWTANPQPTKSVTKAFNPFKQFEDNEKRLLMRRKRLLADEVFMKDTKAHLKSDAVQAHKQLQGKKTDELSDMRTFFGPYSMSMRKTQESTPKRNQMSQKNPKGASKSLKTLPGARNRDTAETTLQVKDMQQKLLESSRTVEQVAGIEEKPRQTKDKKKPDELVWHIFK